MSPTETLVKESVENVIDEVADKVVDDRIVETLTENIRKSLREDALSEKNEEKVISYWSISRVDKASADAANLYLGLSQESKVIPFESIVRNN